jgi:hypothetical protein
MEAQGYQVQDNVLFHDNKSAIGFKQHAYKACQYLVFLYYRLRRHG